MKNGRARLVAGRDLTCGLCKRKIKKGSAYTGSAALSRGQKSIEYFVPLHFDCESLQAASVASRAAA